jgi:hypothetical protein
MKKLLLLLCFIGSAALASGVAWTDNNAGGRIIITNEVCKDPDGKAYKKLNRIYMFTAEGITMEGCYYLADQLINAIWINGREMKYPISGFTMYEKAVSL